MSKKTLQEMQPLADVLNRDIVCACGKTHRANIDAVVIGRGAMEYVPELLQQHGMKTVMLLEDTHTHEAAGEQAAQLIRNAGIEVYEHIYQRADGWLTADEVAMEEGVNAFRACENRPDVIISVGSGTLNDLGKGDRRDAGRRAAVDHWNRCFYGRIRVYGSSAGAQQSEGNRILQSAQGHHRRYGGDVQSSEVYDTGRNRRYGS